MEPATTLVLTIQLLALFSIAGALLLYLLCKVRGDASNGPAAGHGLTTLATSAGGAVGGGTVLVTSADTALGLQLCTHLAQRGCRVFAGLKEPVDSLPAKLLRGWMKVRTENGGGVPTGTIVPLRVDVTREDVLREATEAMGAHLNVGERGIRAVINTAGVVYRGRIDQQDSQQWEAMFKTNVLGSLRTARAFTALLRPTRGRLIVFGAGNEGDGLVAFTASRLAVDGCAEPLRRELQPYGIDVVALDSSGVPAESLFRSPMPFSSNININDNDGGATGEPAPPTQYSAEVLTASALSVIERALWDARPSHHYQLSAPASKFQLAWPCSSRMLRRKTTGGRVQKM